MTVSKEHPILFSGEMVRAILDGRKTQTRRIISARNSTVCGYTGTKMWDRLAWDSKTPHPVFVDGLTGSAQYLHVPAWSDDPEDCELMYRVRCKWEPGQNLWIREASELSSVCGYNVPGATMEIRYKADGEVLAFNRDAFGTVYTNKTNLFKSVPSIHMPRWASRITLEVAGVRTQRLQDIEPHDACAEGVHLYCQDKVPGQSDVHAFAALWDKINGERAPWASNPRVWVIDFERTKPCAANAS